MFPMIPFWRCVSLTVMTFSWGLALCPDHTALARWIAAAATIGLVVEIIVEKKGERNHG